MENEDDNRVLETDRPDYGYQVASSVDTRCFPYPLIKSDIDPPAATNMFLSLDMDNARRS